MFQQTIIIGYLGQDPESRTTGGGMAVTNCSVATSERWKDKASGEMKDRTEWHSVVFWGRQAEVAAEYLSKGSLVTVVGTLRTEKWQDKQGNDRYTTKLHATELKLMPNGEKRQAAHTPQEHQSRQQEQRPAASTQDFDDDIPF